MNSRAILTLTFPEVMVTLTDIHPCHDLEKKGTELWLYSSKPLSIHLAGEHCGLIEGAQSVPQITVTVQPSNLCSIRLHVPEITHEPDKRPERTFAVQFPASCDFSFREGQFALVSARKGVVWSKVFGEPRRLGELPPGVTVL
jgi:hypothetical protein